MKIETAKDLEVYKMGFQLAMDIFEVTKRFSGEEKYALTSQIRRPSRSVCLNLREAWAKRRYEAHFVSKLTDCDGENSETDSSLDFALACSYITSEQHRELTRRLCRNRSKAWQNDAAISQFLCPGIISRLSTRSMTLGPTSDFRPPTSACRAVARGVGGTSDL